MTQGDDLRLRGRIDGRQCRCNLARVVLVHGHRYAQTGLAPANGAGYFEAADVSAHQERSVAGMERLEHQFLTGNRNVEQIEAPIGQKDAVVNRGCETHRGDEIGRRGGARAPERAAGSHASAVALSARMQSNMRR